MSVESLPKLVSQAQEILTQIRQHPRFKHLQYSPDLSISDACQALGYLQWELEAEGYQTIEVSHLEAFNE
jgi:hypothetical protein